MGWGKTWGGWILRMRGRNAPQNSSSSNLKQKNIQQLSEGFPVERVESTPHRTQTIRTPKVIGLMEISINMTFLIIEPFP